jgi:hypothetical protein
MSNTSPVRPAVTEPAAPQATTASIGGADRLRRIPTRSATFVGLIAGALFLSGCAMPQVASMSPHLPERPAAAPSTPASPTAAPQASAAASAPADATDGETTSAETTIVNSHADRGDLYRGSLTRKLSAGDRTVVVDYWTDADPKTFSATTSTVVKLSAHLEGSDSSSATEVKVSRFLATEDDGTTTTTLSEDRGEFVITSPYSYGTALTVRPADPTATSVTLSVQFELLVETAPGSGAYARQTVLDSVRIALPATTPTAAPVVPTTVRGTAS